MSPNRRSTVGAFAPESPDRHCPLFATAVRGLEGLAAEELAQRGHRVLSVRKRRLQLASPQALAFDRPRTVDDLLLQAARTPDPGSTKADLERLRGWLGTADPEPARALLDRTDPVVCVSASISGRRTYNRYDLEAVIGSVLAEGLGARFASRRGGARPPANAVEWRAVLSPDGLLLGLRGSRPPLHRRAWKTASIPGTLHPPVAAAMARLAGIESAMTVLDPCCGAGTILVEAGEPAPHAHLIGGDVDPAALAASARNARHLPGIALREADAARLPFPTGSIDRIVTNPAWGRQVATRRSFTALLAEWRRVIALDGRLVCLVSPELLHHFDTGRSGWNVVETRQLSLAGQHPVIVVARP
ncbi:methyltransferase domain-containing protein [Glycomyces tarimensis]